MHRTLPVLRCLGLALALSTTVPHLAAADPLLVVASAASPIKALTQQDLADIYLDRNDARNLHGALPLDRAEEPLRERYYRSLGISPSTFRAHWAKRIFTGRGRPPTTVASVELASALERNGNAIFYVESAERPPRTRVLATVD